MDDKIYPKSTIDRFVDEHLLFKDAKLKKYYERNEQRDLKKFRDRVHTKYPNKNFEKIVYVIITDSIRDIILETVSRINDVMKSMGDLIVSGGEAFNMYVPYGDRIITSDIDTKFIPRMRMDAKYFGKLQGLKLILWNRLGELAKQLNMRVKNRIVSVSKKNPKLFKFLGIGFKQSGPYVTRRYSLIKKKKFGGAGAAPSQGDIFIDVELFALDLNIRVYSPKSGRVEDFNIGGILDIAIMRPDEFGYVVSFTKRKGITYRNVNTNKLIVNNNVFIAGRDFLIEDIYLMHKLKLRPEKKEKDRQRLLKLAKMFHKGVQSTDSIDVIFKKIQTKLKRLSPKGRVYKNVSMSAASRVDPQKYKNFTTPPSKERLSTQVIHGLKTVVPNTKVEGYKKSSGGERFNLKNLKWRKVSNATYIKNEYNLRPEKAQNIPNNLNIPKTLYGFNPNRNKWVPKQILNRAAAIPFIGLKK